MAARVYRTWCLVAYARCARGWADWLLRGPALRAVVGGQSNEGCEPADNKFD